MHAKCCMCALDIGCALALTQNDRASRGSPCVNPSPACRARSVTACRSRHSLAGRPDLRYCCCCCLFDEMGRKVKPRQEALGDELHHSSCCAGRWVPPSHFHPSPWRSILDIALAQLLCSVIRPGTIGAAAPEDLSLLMWALGRMASVVPGALDPTAFQPLRSLSLNCLTGLRPLRLQPAAWSEMPLQMLRVGVWRRRVPAVRPRLGRLEDGGGPAGIAPPRPILPGAA